MFRVMLETLSELVQEQPLISLGVGVAVVNGLCDVFHLFNGEKPEVRQMKVEDYSFEGRCIARAKSYGFMRPFLGDEGVKLEIFQTKEGNYIARKKAFVYQDYFQPKNPQIAVCKVKSEKKLLKRIKQLKRPIYESVNISIAQQLYDSGLESFKELLPKPKKLIHIE